MVKRAIDVLIAGSGLVVLSPLLAVMSLAIRINMGSPILFSQLRPGRNRKAFRLIKFRTMSDERSASGDLLPDEQRLTTLGAFLRSSSLDELPQLWNVLSGSLSLVGPRPLLMQYLNRYTSEQARRHDVLPGITGCHRSTDAMRLVGRRSLTMTSGMSITGTLVLTWQFFSALSGI